MSELESMSDSNLNSTIKKLPVIMEYQDYRKFLYDAYEYKKALNAGFSYRRFSQLVGLKSPNYLQLVIQGKRHLTSATAERVAKVLGLDLLEIDYFIALVNEEGASSEKERIQFKRQRMIAAKKLATEFLDQSEKEILEKWYHLLILEFVSLNNFEPTADFIRPRLLGLVSDKEIEHSLNLLVRLKFIKIENEKYVKSEPVLSTGFGIFLQAQLQSLHAQQLVAWSNLLEKTNPEEQENHMLNIPINSKNIPKLQERIVQFQEEIIGWLKDEENPDRVVQLGTYLVPLP